MRKRVLLSAIIFLLCFAIVIILLKQNHIDLVTSEKISVVKNIKNIKPASNLKKSVEEKKVGKINISSKHVQKRLGRSASKIEEQYVQLAKENLVEYEIKNGLAFAFGDVVLGEPDDKTLATKGLSEIPDLQIWEDAIIPYYITPDLVNESYIKEAIDYFNKETPVKFVPFNGEEDAVIFVSSDKNCYSYLGKIGGHQPVFLSSECRKNEILHELLHALGFIHEQSRSDRSKSIEILWDNIQDDFQNQYAIVPAKWDLFQNDYDFDYNSIMLYRDNTFAINSDKKTMRSISNKIINPSVDKLSVADIKKLHKIYGE